MYKLYRDLRFYVSFLVKNKYLPSFFSRKSFNEKVIYRKRKWSNSLFSVCSDKIESKNYVSKIIGEEIIIPNLYVGDLPSMSIVKGILEEHGDCFIKANHNSGPVYKLSVGDSEEKIATILSCIAKQLKIDFGYIQNESWYSQIKRQVLIEKQLKTSEDNGELRDYKFHVFEGHDGDRNFVLQVDYNRSSNHNRSLFDSNLNHIDIELDYPCINKAFSKPVNFQKMVDIAIKLSEPFSYVRVDLYNIGGEIYFGELTFAHESGKAKFSSKEDDIWFGSFWQKDPRK
ncbi:glycosyltransferase [Pseudoalteromonas sp. SMS1]|uniref:ATP-grasp fold amidoligase family protein n=1 Tax=Pseudoalteromonas sp. SMS1 TaxID=2908894 RepID=UPI001F331DCF|nr:ATP-grasp fold amidoligase family protein [Pseudoalteromonas sp. SMS1]MCF2857428.1 glycosyltransferase [Pseudoalteromonas sp. SMS1]